MAADQVPTSEPAGEAAAEQAAPEPHPLYEGSCHCGHVRYSVRLNLTTASRDFHNAIVTKCNCTICQKSGMAAAAAAPQSSFSLLSPPGGEAALPDYTFGSGRVHHRFCPGCGIKCWVRGWFPDPNGPPGAVVEFLNVNVRTIDRRADGGEMAPWKDIKVQYWDGREGWEGFMKGLADEPYGMGMW